MSHRSLLVALLALSSCGTDSTLDADTSWVDDAGVEYDVEIPADAEYHPTRVIVGFWDADRPDTVETGLFQGRMLRSLGKVPAAVYELDPGVDVRAAVEDLRATELYRWVEPDYVRTISVDDPYRSFQWNLDNIDAEGAWALSDGTGAVVAVIDTGVTSGPNDGLNAMTSGYDFVNGDTDASDDNGHGTHVAGTVAQATNNGIGVAGLAYGATIMPIKVLNSAGSGYVSDTVDGINWATTNGADVINLSLGSSSYSSAEAAAVANAYASGVFVAAASGNARRRSVDYPAAYNGAVAVGATRYDDTRARYSNRGSDLDLMAPGGDTSRDDNGDGYADGILQETFDPDWGYYFFQGTSMASPHVAAAAALLMAEGATNVEAEDLLIATATDLGSTGWDSTYGWGLIQPAAALAGLSTEPVDGDGDGYTDDVDCDDGDASINPGATEVCGDGIDQDCSGADETCPPVDADGDGYTDDVDCDDADAGINPGAEDICEDGIDQDCSGADETCPAVDADGDGYDETEDCNDADAGINPGAEDVCEDGIDQDCSGADAVCSSAPTISGVSHSTARSDRTITWSTDEDTTGEVCNSHGDCATTALGTSHSATIHKRGSSFTIVATDVDGETDSYTEAY